MTEDCPCLKKIKEAKDEDKRKIFISIALECYANTPWHCINLLPYLQEHPADASRNS